MTLFDWTQYLPESLKTKYEAAGVPQTIIEKVLQLLVQVLSGNAGTTADFESKLYELKYFWDAYGTKDLSKLKTLLDSNGITTKVAYINEICGTSTPVNSEKAYLATVQAVGKMKGTIKGINNILRLFGITLDIIPWYDPTYLYPDPEECNVAIIASLDSSCLSEESYSVVREIVELLIDVCAKISYFEIVKRFYTLLAIDHDDLVTKNIDQYLCTYWNWRDARDCCDLYVIANSGVPSFYISPDNGDSVGYKKCDGPYDHSGVYTGKCGDPLDCSLDRLDVALVDPIIRACSEVDVNKIDFQSNNIIRYYLENSPNLQNIDIGDPIYVSKGLDDSYIHGGEFFITNFSDKNWVEVTNILVSNNSYDEATSEATLAITLLKGINREILSYNSPIRTPIYDIPIIPGIDSTDSIGAVVYTANEFIGDNWIKAGDYRECPDIFEAYYSIICQDFNWTFFDSDSLGDTYYLDMSDSTGDSFVISEPHTILENGINLIRGVYTDLSLGEWDYEYNNLISSYTLFVKLLDGSDPNLKQDHSLEAGVKKDYCLDNIETHGKEMMHS